MRNNHCFEAPSPQLACQATTMGNRCAQARAVTLSMLLAGGLSPAYAWQWPLPFYPEAGALMTWMGGAVLLLALWTLARRSQRAIHRAEQRLEQLTERTGTGIIDVNLLDRRAYVSPALLRLLGLPPFSKALPFAVWHKHLPLELVSENALYLQHCIAEGATTWEREIRVPRPNGENQSLRVRFSVERRSGRAARLQGICVAIAERKMPDSEMASSHADWNEEFHDLNHLHELSTQLQDTSELKVQLELILGTLAHFHGAKLGLLCLYDRHTHKMGIGASLGIDAEANTLLIQAGAGVCSDKSRLVIEDMTTDQRFGNYRELARQHGVQAVHSTPLINSQGEALGALTIFLAAPHRPTQQECTLADICARKAIVFIERACAREELLASQVSFEAVLDASGAPFVLLDPLYTDRKISDFRWTYINRAAARALQQQPIELLGRAVLETLAGMTTASPGFGHCVQVIERQRTVEFDIVQEQNRKARWFHCIASPYRDGVAIWFTDISERIHNELQLRHSDRRKDEFLATLAHELRSPLAPIRQSIQLLMSEHASEAQKRWGCEVAHRQVRRMALLLDDLLDVSRISRGTLTLRKTVVHLDDVIASAVETAGPHIHAKGHQLSLHASPSTILVEADALRLSQVIANLLTNAAKYTPAMGSITLVTYRQDDDAVIEIRDNGIGIPSEAIPDLFHMFAQLRQASDKTDDGLGIGLALSKGLVELHGGSLTVHSEGQGQGSVFIVRLTHSNETVAATRPLPAARSSHRTARLCKVLIADDNRDASDTLAALLELEGHETHRAYDGIEALALWQRVQPDVCLLDIGMPGYTGYQVAREIRALPGGNASLLVAVTGWSQLQDRQESFDAGFDLHLTKPVSPEQIIALLQSPERCAHTLPRPSNAKPDNHAWDR